MYEGHSGTVAHVCADTDKICFIIIIIVVTALEEMLFWKTRLNTQLAELMFMYCTISSARGCNKPQFPCFP